MSDRSSSVFTRLHRYMFVFRDRYLNIIVRVSSVLSLRFKFSLHNENLERNDNMQLTLSNEAIENEIYDS